MNINEMIINILEDDRINTKTEALSYIVNIAREAVKNKSYSEREDKWQQLENTVVDSRFKDELQVHYESFFMSDSEIDMEVSKNLGDYYELEPIEKLLYNRECTDYEMLHIKDSIESIIKKRKNDIKKVQEYHSQFDGLVTYKFIMFTDSVNYRNLTINVNVSNRDGFEYDLYLTDDKYTLAIVEECWNKC